jgi:hypothetical protein
MNTGSWSRWVLLPWRQPAVAVALVGALALPALLLTSGPMFRTAASDEITVGVLAALDPGPAGVIVQSSGSFDDDRLGTFADDLETLLAGIGGLGQPTRTLLSSELAPATIDSAPLERPPGPGDVRVIARPGAADNVELLAGERSGGLLVPASLADEYGLTPGSMLGLGVGEARVAGVYRDLWATEPDPFWQQLPRDMLPRFQRVFAEPSFEMVIADEMTLRRLDLFGRARWEAPLTAPPTTWAAFNELAADYRRLESALARNGALGESYRSWAADPEAPATFVTALPDAQRSAARLVEELEQPIRTATWSGTVAGLLLSTLGAVFVVRRRRNDHRLMAADGDAAWRFFVRAVAQYAAPAVVATAVGIAAGWAMIRFLGPSGTATWSVVPWGSVAAASAVAVVLAGVVTATISVRLVDAMERPIGRIGPIWLLGLVGVAATMWVQVGRERGGDVNPLIVSFPFVGVITGVLLTVAVLRLALLRLRRTGTRLPTPLFLAWRALSASETGALSLTASLGLAAGLVVLSVSFVGTIDAATEAKAATTAGAVSRLDTIENVDATVLPPGSTVVLSLSTRIGDRSAEVLAIDPDSYASAVVWPDEFGMSAAEVVEVLAADSPSAVPAVAVEGRGAPATGEFGLQRPFPYRVVGTVASAPMASTSGLTLLVRADVFEAFARDRWERGAEPIDPVDREVADTLGRELEYVSPLDAFGDTVLSSRPLAEISGLAEELGWPVRSTATFDGQVGDVDARVTRWAFDYLGLLALVAGVVAVAVMAFYLAERRHQREVTAVMTHQMGIGHRTNVAAAVVEMVGLVVAAVAAGSVAAVITARRVFPAFEPDPDVPPNVALLVDVRTVLAVLAASIVIVGLVAAWSERSVSQTEKARVLRG